VLDSGTVTNADPNLGAACIAEKRAWEMIEQGEPKSACLRFADRVAMQARDLQGGLLFGEIQQMLQCYGEKPCH